jgi:hypothetical protein
MKLARPLAALALVLGASSPAFAKKAPEFDVDSCVAHATDVVVAKHEGATFGTRLQVLEVWRGSGLKSGDLVELPDLASFADQEQRRVCYGWTPADLARPAKYVSGRRMILFLEKKREKRDDPDSKLVWDGAHTWGGARVSVAWIEDGDAYVIAQPENPGPQVIVRAGTENELREKVARAGVVLEALAKAKSIADLAERAKALEPIAADKNTWIVSLGLAELRGCGVAAVPVLERHLLQPRNDIGRGEAIKALVAAGGEKAGPALAHVLEAELAFWRTTLPGIQASAWSEVRFRAYVTEEVLEALAPLRSAAARQATLDTRALWGHAPSSVEAGDVKKWILKGCDDVLKALDEPEKPPKK